LHHARSARPSLRLDAHQLGDAATATVLVGRAAARRRRSLVATRLAAERRRRAQHRRHGAVRVAGAAGVAVDERADPSRRANPGGAALERRSIRRRQGHALARLRFTIGGLMRFALLILVAAAGCGGSSTLREPDEYVGCGSDEHWRTFDDREKAGQVMVSQAQGPIVTAPTGTVPFSMRPRAAWLRGQNDPGMPAGDVPYINGPGCNMCCPEFNTGG